MKITAENCRLRSQFRKSAASALPIEENQASGRQPRRAAFWEAEHTDAYVSIPKRPRNAGSRPEAPVFSSRF
jgi:hypothetical protein